MLHNYEVKSYKEGYFLIKSKWKGMLIVSPRDLVIYSARVVVSETRELLVSFSVELPDHPLEDGAVRADVIIGGWILDKIDENTTRGIYICENDLKGSFPKFVLKAGAAMVGIAPGMLVKWIKEHPELMQQYKEELIPLIKIHKQIEQQRNGTYVSPGDGFQPVVEEAEEESDGDWDRSDLISGKLVDVSELNITAKELKDYAAGNEDAMKYQKQCIEKAF